jgi:hypothetical protein
MSENIDGGSTENTDTSAADVDAQLAEMHSAETAEAEAPETKEPAAEAAPEVKKVVPLAALHEERRARQELQRQLAEDRRQHQETMARFNQRIEALVTPQRQAPDREQDPVGYLDERIGQVALTQQQLIQQNQFREQAQRQAQAMEQAQNHVRSVAHEFVKTTPDLGDAVTHLNTMRTRELIALGNDPTQAATRAAQELDEASIAWAVNGRNPAETAYELAKARGYTPKAAQSAADKIAAQQKGTAAARSLGGGGAVSAGKLTAEALANMSDADFAKLSESDWRQAMGG